MNYRLRTRLWKKTGLPVRNYSSFTHVIKMNHHLEEIVCHAYELPEEEQAEWLDQACGGDGLIRAEAGSMLLRMREADAFFSGTPPVRRPPEEQEGAQIGHWKLLQRIGEGGFGTVWMAAQEKPVRRRVALKIIKAGMDTKEVVARFEQERQALAMMDHPNIARIFDAGSTDSGRPYFVMELVKGIPITAFCDERRLGIRERLLLFMEVCGAIGHAHQKGVIHRDIKPSNVMVTLHGDKAVPKIIDFGIAKATQHPLTDHTLFTRFEHFVGTPVYMSPEQTALSGLDTDTRSDIYALGILLYELITGSAPFDEKTLISAGYEGMRRIIRETDPPRPSQRLSTVAEEERSIVAAARQVTPAQVRRLVEPELDWIVMKAIEKDRSRRYETANAFALDIHRFLADQTVSAIPPSKAYQFRKFARRHRAGLRVAAAMAMVLMMAAVASIMMAVRARNAEAESIRQLRRAEEVAQLLIDILHSPDVEYDNSKRDNITMIVLDRAAAMLQAGLNNQPELRTRLQGALSKAYAALGRTADALALQEPVLEFNRRNLGPEHPATIQAMAALAWTYDYASRREEAVILQRQVLDWCRRKLPAGHADTVKAMSNLGRTLYFAGQIAEGTALQEKALAISRRALGSEHRHTLELMHWLAAAYHGTGRETEARRLDEELLPLRLRVSGKYHPETIRAMAAVAVYLTDPAVRASTQAEIVELSEKVNGPEHPFTLAATANQVSLLADSRRYTEALAASESLLPRMLKVNKLGHADTLWVMAMRASCLYELGRKTDSMTKWEEVVRLRTEVLSPGHWDTLGAKAKLACVYNDPEIGRPRDALQIRKEILPLLEKLGPGQEDAAKWVRGDLILNYEALGMQADAERLRGGGGK